MCEFLGSRTLFIIIFNYKYYYMKNSYDRVRLNQIFFFFPTAIAGKKIWLYSDTIDIIKKHFVMELGKKL